MYGHGMTKERFKELQYGNADVSLTEEEQMEGWHWCYGGWDGLLMHPLDEEYKYCECDHAKKFTEWKKRR